VESENICWSIDFFSFFTDVGITVAADRPGDDEDDDDDLLVMVIQLRPWWQLI
jgi:hypothetical protein